ncbi:MAG: S41 family peptidase [bacterium]
MKENIIRLLICIVLLLCSRISAEEIWGAQYPAPLPDAKKISFSYYGDIWVVPVSGGKAERLTVSLGYEGRSFWSPDRKWLAFQTDQWGSDDICVIAADGSSPAKRMTYYSTYDVLYGWTPDSKNVVFTSQRHTLRPVLYKVSIHGGLPEMITSFTAYHVFFASQGDRFFYTRGGSAWWRRHYKGGANSDIWVKVLPDKNSLRLTDYPGKDAYPMYSAVDQKLYFLSDRGEMSVSNIWRMDLETEAFEQMTFEKEDIHFPTMSFDGTLIAYECSGYLYTYDVAKKERRKLVISVNEDYKESPFVFKSFTHDASEFSLSPNEDELAFIVHGDIFVMQLEDGKSEKITRVTETPFIEKYVSWHPTEEKLVYSSMADGDMDIYTIEPKNEEKLYDDFFFTTTKLMETRETEIKPVFSPDGEKIAYFKNKNELFVMNKHGKANIKICPENDVLWIDWSPDSKWLTFSRTVLGWREDIFVVLADGSKEPINISNHPNDDYKPMWSSDGRRIAFASRDAIGNLWMKYVFLHKEDEDKTEDELEEAASDSTGKNIVIKIDFEDIEDHIHDVTRVLGWYNIVAQSPDGKQFAIYSNNQNSNDIWTVDWLGKELKQITKSNIRPRQFTVSRDKKDIYYLSGTGGIFSASIASAQSKPLSFNVQIGIDIQEEREQVFKQAWWALKDGFYDSDFHGIDWDAMYHKYKDLALHMRTIRDFHDVISMMIGELNASHLGIWKGDGGGETTGALGIVYDSGYKGKGVKVKDIIPDAPADAADVDVRPGDIITYINGKKIEKGEDFYALLRNKNNKEIMLTVIHDGKEKNIKVTPKTPWSILGLVRGNWVKLNKDYVHEQSNNRLGYLYIASMSDENLKKFEKDLYKEMDKRGLVIDIRYNGGGNIHEQIIEILRRTSYMYSKERGGDKEYASLFRWDKPTVVLINEFCYSDAEIFPAAFKELKLGKLIGVPTFGAVIGTNNIRLLDGSVFRIPGTGWFLLTGENLENMPVEPDVYIENRPEEDGSSNDTQLTQAIQVLLEQLGGK